MLYITKYMTLQCQRFPGRKEPGIGRAADLLMSEIRILRQDDQLTGVTRITDHSVTSRGKLAAKGSLISPKSGSASRDAHPLRRGAFTVSHGQFDFLQVNRNEGAASFLAGYVVTATVRMDGWRNPTKEGV